MDSIPTHISRRAWLAGLLLVLAGLLALTPQTVFAQADDEEACSSCHSEEHSAWSESVHGTVQPESVGDPTGASCVDCHGAYVKGHPEEGTMPLTVDSSLCQDCHSATYDVWMHTQHAGEGVQCISCHRPHSQDLRLTDEALCQSCHRDSLTDSLHSAHRIGEVTCTSCHTNGVGLGQQTVSMAQIEAVAAASHDFIHVSTTSCLDCHRSDVTSTEVNERAQPAPVVYSAELAEAQHNNKVWAAISATNMGLGLGFGGILGIVFMLVAARIFPRRDS